ncbi:MAG: tetratricopeptide repeat protein [Chloroflexota bacterium]
MLPFQLSGFVGRERELGELADLLHANRLLTLTGPGGVGKTRLALELASRCRERFADGTSFVSLAAIRDPSLVLTTIAQTLGIPRAGPRLPQERLVDHLRDRTSLVLLDNFEQVMAAASAIADLLAACPHLHIVVTSRERLRLRGEQVYPVKPLSLDAAERLLTEPGTPLPEAVQLFVERARARRPDFELTSQNAASVLGICRRVDGLPLAIELATARLGVLPPHALLGYLDRRLPLLTDGARDLPDRQRTLADTLAWSYELLTEPERRLFIGLSVFAGGCTLEAVEAVCGTPPAPDPPLFEVISALVEKSLVLADEQGQEPRLSMLETIREYASDQLDHHEDADALRRRHATYYLRLAERVRGEQHGIQAAVWLDRLEVEHANLRAALDWGESCDPDESHETGPTPSDGAIGRLDLATQLVDAMMWFWIMRGHLPEGRERQARLLARAAPGTSTRARALLSSSALARYRGDHAAAVALGQEGLALWQALGERRQVAIALARLGDAHSLRGDYREARQYLERSAEIFRELGGESDLEHPTRLMLGQAAWVVGELTHAQRLFEENLAAGRTMGDLHTVQVSLRHLGLLAHRRGELDESLVLFDESLRHVRQLDDRACVMSGLAALAITAAALGRAEHAAHLLAAVSHLNALTGVALMPFLREPYESRVAAVRAQLGERDFESAWAHGSALSLDEAIEAALAVRGEHVQDMPAAAAGHRRERNGTLPANLTPREVDVLRLIVAGWSTKQIASELVVTAPTIERHITHIYEKIGARGRAAAAAFALRHGIE